MITIAARMCVVPRSTHADLERISAYLPSNYHAVCDRHGVVHIVGTDVAGWTLDGYVIPRLASGLIFAKEYTQ